MIMSGSWKRGPSSNCGPVIALPATYLLVADPGALLRLGGVKAGGIAIAKLREPAQGAPAPTAFQKQLRKYMERFRM